MEDEDKNPSIPRSWFARSQARPRILPKYRGFPPEVRESLRPASYNIQPTIFTFSRLRDSILTDYFGGRTGLQPSVVDAGVRGTNDLRIE